MDHRIHAIQVDLVGVAHIALHHGQRGMRLQVVAEPLDVEGDDLVALASSFGTRTLPL